MIGAKIAVTSPLRMRLRVRIPSRKRVLGLQDSPCGSMVERIYSNTAVTLDLYYDLSILVRCESQELLLTATETG